MLILYITNVIKQRQNTDHISSCNIPPLAKALTDATRDTCILQATFNNIPDLSNPQTDLSNVLIIQTDKLDAENVQQDTLANWQGEDWAFQFAYHLANDEYLISLDPIL